MSNHDYLMNFSSPTAAALLIVRGRNTTNNTTGVTTPGPRQPSLTSRLVQSTGNYNICSTTMHSIVLRASMLHTPSQLGPGAKCIKLSSPIPGGPSCCAWQMLDGYVSFRLPTSKNSKIKSSYSSRTGSQAAGCRLPCRPETCSWGGKKAKRKDAILK